jgi:hypothetical protein
MSHRARLALALALAAAPGAALAQTAEPAVGVRASAELGFLFVADHFVRFGVDGSRIDYRRDGAQDNLYPFVRLSAEIDVRRRHHVTLLYQPLEIVSRETLTRDLRIDGVTFPNRPLSRVPWIGSNAVTALSLQRPREPPPPAPPPQVGAGSADPPSTGAADARADVMSFAAYVGNFDSAGVATDPHSLPPLVGAGPGVGALCDG